MKKTSIILLFLLPIIAFGIIAVTGIVINNFQNIPITELEIVSDRITEIPGEDGETLKIAFLTTEGETLQLFYKFSPEDATTKEFVWTVISGEDYAEINQFGIVTVKKTGGDAVVKLSDKDGRASDTLRLIIR